MWSVITFLTYLSLDTALGTLSNTHTTWNYTWLVLNGQGKAVWAISTLTNTQPWPALFPDICQLALGIGYPWDVENYEAHFKTKPPQRPDPDFGLTTDSHGRIGCGNSERRAGLKFQPFYVCPGNHRSRQAQYTCGGSSSFYCHSWGCETTGDVYWKPSSSWDYIKVQYNTPIPQYSAGLWRTLVTSTCKNQWCNTLKITFTEPGKRATDWEHGYSWGLALYKDGSDDGLTFKIKLLKEPFNQHKPIPIGPNPVLIAPPVPAPTKPPPAKNLVSTTNISLSPISFNATVSIPMVHAPPPLASLKHTKNVILQLLNATHQAINNSLGNCWLCLNSQPPFYEGIVIPLSKNLTYSNNSYNCPWPEKHSKGLTLARIVGQGTCLSTDTTSSMLYQPYCNSTIIPHKNASIIQAPPNSWWVCKDGITPCIYLQQFYKHSDFCLLIQLIPRLSYHTPQSFLEVWDPPTNHPRSKREAVSALTISVLLGLGVAGTGTGVASLLIGSSKFDALQAAIEEDVRRLQQGIDDLAVSLSSLAEVVLQNRRGLDLLFLQQGGLCAALKEECCFYIDKTGAVRDSMKILRESLDKRKKERDSQTPWYESWFSGSSWLTSLLPAIIGPLIGLLLLISFGPWAFNRLTRLIKQQIDSLLSKPIQIHYQRLEMTDSDGPAYDGSLRFPPATTTDL